MSSSPPHRQHVPLAAAILGPFHGIGYLPSRLQQSWAASSCLTGRGYVTGLRAERSCVCCELCAVNPSTYMAGSRIQVTKQDVLSLDVPAIQSNFATAESEYILRCQLNPGETLPSRGVSGAGSSCFARARRSSDWRGCASSDASYAAVARPLSAKSCRNRYRQMVSALPARVLASRPKGSKSTTGRTEQFQTKECNGAVPGRGEAFALHTDYLELRFSAVIPSLPPSLGIACPNMRLS